MSSDTKRLIAAVGLALSVLGGGALVDSGHAETPAPAQVEAASAADVAALAANVESLTEAVRDLRQELRDLRTARERDLERAARGGDR